jgi:hypothetical protein
MSQSAAFFALGGGMDLVTPEIHKPPGRVVASLNYEPTAAGYRRLRGFERFDGRIAPSDTNYWLFNYFNGQPGMADLVEGDPIHVGFLGKARFRYILHVGPGSTEFGTFGTIVLAYAGGDVTALTPPFEGAGRAPDYFGLFDLFVPGQENEENNPAWKIVAREGARSLIQPVPGTGPVRGVWYEGGRVIAVRDDLSASTAVMHKSSPEGWQVVGTARTLPFVSGGPVEVDAGSLIVGATSNASSRVVAVRVTSGSWAGGDAAGFFYVRGDQIGAFGAETLDCYLSGETGSSPTHIDVATVAGDSTFNALPPGGRYEFIDRNFYGAAALKSTYGVNGVGPAFEYRSSTDTLTPIPTGMAVDTPTHIAAHAGHLFLSFPGGSIQYSQPGEPGLFSPVLGAGEIGIGCDCTGFANPPNALAIFGSGNISLLYGHDSGDFVLETLNREAGALPHTAQKLGDIVYMDNRGLRSLSASQAYGNFTLGTLSRLVAPLLEDYRRDGNDPVASFVARAKDQYWCVFENGAGIVAHFGGRTPAILPFNLGKTITCACSVEADGLERLFFGCDDGYVYELDRGTSFDGAPIEHYLRLPFHNFGSPHQNKRLHKLTLEVEAAGPTNLSVSADLDYGAVRGLDSVFLGVTSGGGAIDDLGSNELYFASQIETIAQAHVGGLARNVSLKVSGLTSTEEPHTLTGVSYFVSPRGRRR